MSAAGANPYSALSSQLNTSSTSSSAPTQYSATVPPTIPGSTGSSQSSVYSPPPNVSTGNGGNSALTSGGSSGGVTYGGGASPGVNAAAAGQAVNGAVALAGATGLLRSGVGQTLSRFIGGAAANANRYTGGMASAVIPQSGSFNPAGQMGGYGGNFGGGGLAGLDGSGTATEMRKQFQAQQLQSLPPSSPITVNPGGDETDVFGVSSVEAKARGPAIPIRLPVIY